MVAQCVIHVTSLMLCSPFINAVRLSTAGTTDAKTTVDRWGKDVYVTFVSGPDYWKYAFVLTSTLRNLGHTHTHTYMVKEGSAEAKIGPAIEQLAAKLGLHIKFQEFKPIDVPWKTAYPFWNEAWQRVVLYNMSQFTRMLHLDADVLVYRNIEHILTHGAIPSAARRMGSCINKQQMCTTTPVSNVMLIEPNATIAKQIDGLLQSGTDHGDETVQFIFHSGLQRFSPDDVMYSDCFESISSPQLEQWGLSSSRMPAVVHLGIPFKSFVNGHAHDIDSLERSHAEAKSLREHGYRFKASLVERWYDHFFSEDVQALLAMAKSISENDASRLAVSDVCD